MNERDTSSFDCKYKHMLEEGAPPDKFGVLYDLLHIEFHGFDSNINVLGLGLEHFGSWHLLSFLKMVWIPLNVNKIALYELACTSQT